MSVELINLGANFHMVDLGKVCVWFSYETPIAFKADKFPTVVRENVWGATTGKHLNWVDGGDKEAKERRVSSEDFNAAMNGLLEVLDYEKVGY